MSHTFYIDQRTGQPVKVWTGLNSEQKYHRVGADGKVTTDHIPPEDPVKKNIDRILEERRRKMLEDRLKKAFPPP